ncbi:MAG TPA: cation:proton antiporter [Candidatus Brocadiia bacterium]|nr:cation:proton antiporter [Candidatus Brocadiia bacterium]
MTFGNSFYEITAILVATALFGLIGLRLRQPLIVAFLAVGVLVGPSGLGIIENHEKIELLAQIGISLLLFVVGLRLDLQMIRTVGPVALATGLGQVIFTSFFGFLIVMAMGSGVTGAVYIATALTFSSTIIIVKLLSDKKEIDSLHGRIAIGFLIVQDVAAILALIGLTAMGSGLGSNGQTDARVFVIVAKGLGFLAFVGFMMRFVLPRVMSRMARSQELMVLFAISWAVLLASAGDYLGFSKEVGAFLGGMSLASTEYRDAIGARLTSLRDFLLLFFFIDLGSRLDVTTAGMQIGKVGILSIFVLVGNPIIVMAIMGYMGYRRRTSFMAGLAVAQISEFSLILGALGLSLGHITPEEMGLITLVGVVTICASTYMILYSGPLYERLAPLLGCFERKNPFRETEASTVGQCEAVDVILLGLGQYGGSLAENLIERRKRLIGVDFDPQALARWREKGVPVIYGDVGAPELLDQLPVNCSRWVVGTMRDRSVSLTILKLLREREFRGKVAMTARDEEDAAALSAAGAHVVLRPFSDAAEQGADALTEAMYALPDGVDWPLAVREIRLKPGSAFSGRPFKDIPLRAETGVSIIAVSRAGKDHFELDGEFRVFPGDRLVLMGDPDDLTRAQDYFQRRSESEESGTPDDSFTVAEIGVSQDSAWVGKSLENLRFRQDYGVNVVGVRRGEERIVSPKAHEVIRAGDRLIIVGSADSIARLKEGHSL